MRPDDPTAGFLDAYLAQQQEAPPAADVEEARPGEWRGVWTWVELAGDEVLPASLELLGRGREIADELGTRNGAVLFGADVEPLASQLGAYGADRVHVLDSPEFAEFDLERSLNALVALVRERRPEILLVPATIQGRNLGAQASMALGCGIVPNCNALTLDATERLVVGHQTSYQERMLSDVVAPVDRPQIFTITPGSFRRPTPDSSRRSQTVRVEPSPAAARPRISVLSREPDRPKTPSQHDAVVAGGFALGSAEGFDLARQLAEELKAYVGGTRGAVAMGWTPPEHLITVTREQLRPRLYVACGVIGEYDHLKAVEDAELVVALTPDPNAPVAEQADLVGVGEPREILQRLVEQIRRARAERVTSR